MGSQVFGCVVVAAQQVEVVAVDLDVAADWQFRGRDEVVVSVDVLVLSALQERPLDDARVFLRRLEDRNGVVGQVERDDEAPVHVLGHLRVEARRVPQDLFVVVHVLEEVDFGLLRNQVVHVAERVDLVAESVVWRHLDLDVVAWPWLLDVAEREVAAVLVLVVGLCELVDALDLEHASVCDQWLFEADLVAGEVPVSDEGLSWLVDVERFRKLLASEIDGEGIASVVGEVDLSDLDCVVGQEVVPHEWQVTCFGVESEHFSVIIKELFLRWNSSST